MRTVLIGASAALAFAVAGCAGMTEREAVGTAGGAAIGGVVGSAATGGSTIGTAAGAAGGGLLGHEAGRRYEERRNR